MQQLRLFHRQFLLVVAILVAATACEGATSLDPGSGQYRGHYSAGFERIEFVPCGETRAWWTTFAALETSAAFEQARRSAPVDSEGRVYVEWFGSPSGLGRHGHANAYERTFTVERVDKVRTPAGSDCAVRQ